jgi:hypothetical protein
MLCDKELKDLGLTDAGVRLVRAAKCETVYNLRTVGDRAPKGTHLRTIEQVKSLAARLESQLAARQAAVEAKEKASAFWLQQHAEHMALRVDFTLQVRVRLRDLPCGEIIPEDMAQIVSDVLKDYFRAHPDARYRRPRIGISNVKETQGVKYDG